MSFDLYTVFSLIIGFLGIGIMVLVHELGHLTAARIFNIEVTTLQFGFGPPIYKFKTKKHDTSFQIGIIPFGGFCRMKGQNDIEDAYADEINEAKTQYSLTQVHPVKRIITYLAGPLFNLIFAIICYIILLAIPTVTVQIPARIALQADYSALYENSASASKDAGLKTGDVIISVNSTPTPYYNTLTETLSLYKDSENVEFITADGKQVYVTPQNGLFGIIPFQECIVDHVKKDSPEYNAGLKPKDKIISVNGKSVSNLFDLFLESQNNHNMVFEVISFNETQSHTVSFICINSGFNFSLASLSVKEKGLPLFKAIPSSLTQCFTSFWSNFKTVYMLLSGKSKPSDTVSTTFKASMNMGLMTTKSFSAGMNNGIRMILFLMSSISISLAVANLLPITAFDGGLILISLAELIAGHSFSQKTHLAFQTGGFITVILIIVLLRFF